MNTKDEIKDSIQQIFKHLNMMGGEEEFEEVLNKVLSSEHRTLQQVFFRHLILPSIKHFANNYDEKWYDLRNEASCETSKKMMPIVENAAIPFI